MTQAQPVSRVDVEDGIGTITFLRAGAYNAFDEALSKDVLARLRHLGKDEAIRVIRLTGEGKAFSAGQDVYELAFEEARSGGKAAGEQLRKRFLPIIMQIRQIEKPVIAQINGVATGAGLATALACDFRVAAETASLIMSPVALGLIPGSGLTTLVPAMVGLGRATELFMLGRTLDAESARSIGLINEVVPAAELNVRAMVLARELGQQPPMALGLIKRALNRSVFPDLEAQMRYESWLQEIAASTGDHRERLAAMTARKER